jgi:NitT/TauT family transport system permease protein
MRIALLAAPWLALLALWYAVRASGLINPALVPAPHAVFVKFIALAQDRLALDIWMSTRRVVVGVFLGVLAAVPVGFAIGWYRGVHNFLDPLINFFRALPPIALIPLVIVYFGIGEAAKTAILFYASFFAGVICIFMHMIWWQIGLAFSTQRFVPTSKRFRRMVGLEAQAAPL